jgi:hypothetical protein
MGIFATELLGIDLPRCDRRLLVISETDGCTVDGLIASTGCRVGSRTLRLVLIAFDPFLRILAANPSANFKLPTISNWDSWVVSVPLFFGSSVKIVSICSKRNMCSVTL